MIIESTTLTTVHIPLETPFVTALRRVEEVTAIRLELTTAEGLRGIGEAPPTVAVTGESLEDIRATIERKLMPPLMKRKLTTMEEAQAILHSRCKGHGSAKAAVDIALYDLMAPITEPIVVDSAVTVSLDTPEKMEAQALAFIRKGCHTLKVKLGGNDGLDSLRIRRIREALPEATILADANQAWSETETLHFLEATQPCEIALLEQPLPAENLKEMAAVTARSSVPILADESAFTLEDVRRVVEKEAAHMVNVKLMKCGGIAKAEEILRYCARHGVSCMVGSMLETPASIRAAAALAKRFEKIVAYRDLDSPLLWRFIPPDAGIGVQGSEISVTPIY